MSGPSKIFEPDAKNVYSLFGDTGNYYYVPSYQRPYSWTEDEVDKLWDDIYQAYQDELESYFLGPMILVKGNNGFEVVDGQQRLATLTILFQVIKDFYSTKLMDSSLGKKVGNCVKSLDEDKTRLRFQVKAEEENQFEHEILRGIPTEISRGAERNSKFLNTANIFKNKFQNLEQDSDVQAGLKDIEEFLKYVMEKVEVISIICTKRDYAIRLFQIINTRGLELSNADLIKSELLSKLNDESEVSAFNSTWNQIETVVMNLDILKEKGNPLDELLTYYEYYLLAENPEQSLYEELKIKFQGKDSNGVAKTPNEIAYDIKLFGDSFSKVVSADDKIVYSLRYIPNQVFWRTILATAVKVKYGDFQRLSKSMRRLYYLYWLAGFTTSKIKQLSFNIVGWVKERKDMSFIDDEIRKKVNYDKTIPKVKDALNSDAYSEKWLKPLLAVIEYGQTDSSHNTFISLDKNINADHIVPEAWKKDAGWVASWTEADVGLHLNKIENLTLLSEPKNKSSQNISWEYKRRKYKGEDGSGLTAFIISQKVAENERWSVSEENQRKAWIEHQVTAILDVNLNEIPAMVTQSHENGYLNEGMAKLKVLEILLNAASPKGRGEIVKCIYDDVENKLTSYDLEETKSGRIRWKGFVRWAVTNLGREKLIENLNGENEWIITDEGRKYLQVIKDKTQR